MKRLRQTKIRVNALTLIETHSTLLKGDGEKKTYYYYPSESEYSELINGNLRKKWMAYYRERIRSFKGTVIKGRTGHFRLEGEPKFLQFALAAGLGSGNSVGFGFIEKVRRDRPMCLSLQNKQRRHSI